MSKGIWVIAESDNGKINKVTYELLSKSAELNSKLNHKITTVLFLEKNFSEEREVLKSLIEYGSDDILLLSCGKEPSINDYKSILRDRLEAELLYKAIVEYKPLVVLSGATSYGRTVMPIVAAKLQTGLTADCTELQMDGETLIQTRPAFGGNIMASIVCGDKRPQMATVRPGVFKASVLSGRKATKYKDSLKFIKFKNYNINLSNDIFAEIIKSFSEVDNVNITEAKVIVAGGRGLGKPEGFNLLEQLAKKLGGVIGASRGAVDLGWIDHAYQVGQTGHTVNPRLYIACGISGAIQHIAGMKGSETVIAINEDPEAPIFKIADYGIVGDLYEIIPAILDQL